MRVLIAKDDPSVSATLSMALTRAGHQCTHARTGHAVLERHTESDVILLDLRLPDMDGFEVLYALRRVSRVATIVVTARSDELTTVHALRRGADDYLTTPVRLYELLARMVAVTRRTRPTVPHHIILGDVMIDCTAHSVRHGDIEVRLTPTECDVLIALAQQPGAVLSRQTVLERVWGQRYSAPSRTLDMHLAQLRRKLPMLTITTLRGVGLRLE